MARARLIIVRGASVAVIERHRAERHYYVFPGGGIEEGESPEGAAVREAWEELGLRVAVRRLVARVTPARPEGTVPNERTTYVFLADVAGGAFGSGQGLEMVGARLERGAYTPRWLPVAALLDRPVYPRSIAQLVVAALATGWPSQAMDLVEHE